MQKNENDSVGLVEIIIRIGVAAGLLFASAHILSPFLDLILWGIILAVTLGPAHAWLTPRLGDSPGRAAFLVSAAGVLFVIVPSFLLGEALGSTIFDFATGLESGKVDIPPPPSAIRDWPVIGSRLYDTWLSASTNLHELIARSSDQVVELGRTLLRTTGGAVIGVLQFTGALIVAGVFLARRESSVQAVGDLFVKIAPQTGERLLHLGEQTVRSVAAGVLGVAIIQAVLVGIGVLVAGVPLAGVWALLCLLLGIMQIPASLIVIPLIIYQFSAAPTLQAVLFAAWMVPSMLADNVLKPLLLGRGVETPMIVIFLGALGGFAARGFIGLFTGAIILVLAFEIFQFWLYSGNEDGGAAASDTP